MAMRRPILEFKSVSKVYQTGDVSYTALREINLVVSEREVVVLMGPSGAGKTTFLTIAGALMRPTSGRVLIAGRDITELDERKLPQVRQEHIGFIFQNFNLLEALSALQNVELVMAARGTTGKVARARAQELLSIVGLDDRQRNTPNMLSGGQKQRVAIARALANNPDLILADEPTANLDSRRGHEIMETLRMIAKELGKTVVAVSHDLRIRQLADRVLWLEDGEFKDISEQPGIRELADLHEQQPAAQ
jgi:putative ABC transport system ATP-binding protein